MNDDLTILASAYLDGDVTADERAQVEASAELLAEVDRLRTVRAVLSSASSDDAPISMRERHLSSALDAWDRLPDNERTGALRDSTPSGANGAAAAGVAAMSSPVRRSSKRRWAQSPAWLGMAAAGLVVVLAGGLVLRNTVSDDSTDSAEVSTAQTESRVAEGGATEVPAPAADAATELEEATAAQAPTGTAPLENASDVDTDMSAEAPPPEEGALEQLTTVDDLAIFASDALDAPMSGDLPEGATVATEAPADSVADEFAETDLAEMPLCQGVDVVVGIAMFGDQRVVVGIDEGRNLAVAYRQDDCSFVARASLS
ncbi:MAG: hypothetical protein ABWZ99_02300 [Ilumatobacteraceae bacterium]